jgi:hypothetical protein
MADETKVPAQTEGAGQTAKPRPEPVNLAMIEAAKRGIDLEPPKREPKPEPVPSAPEAAPAAPAVQADEVPAAADVPLASSEAPAAEEPAVSEPAAADIPAGSPLETLARLAEAATRGRLSPSDEDRATRLMRDFIKGGELAPALEAMTKLPWILGVRAAEQSWPGLDAAARGALLEGIVALPGDNAARLRLSLSRSLAKIDSPAGLRLASLTCRALWNEERGALSAEHSKLIGNVFIGRGKPWVLQLPLAELPAEEAAPIAACAVFSAFNVNNPPITQLSILRHSAPLLGSMHENLLALVAKGVARWSGKWQGALRKEIPELPAALATALKPEKEPAAEPAAAAPAEDEAETPLPPELEEKLKIAHDSGDPELVESVTQEVNAWREAQRAEQESRESQQEEDEEEEPGEAREESKRGRRQRGRERDRERERAERQEKKERPAYVSRDQERQQEVAKNLGSFNFQAAIKQIESYVAQLRNDLGNAQAKLRKTDGGRRTDRISLSVEEANLSPDELRRLILQLEARNTDLQTRVEELLADSEIRAQIMSGSEAPDPGAQLCSLLALKLQEDYADFIALEKGSPDVIVRQHYRGLIRSIFATLVGEGVPLVGDLPPPPPAPMPPPPPPPVDEFDDEEEEDDELDPQPEPISEDGLDEEDVEELPPPSDEAIEEPAEPEGEERPVEEGENSDERTRE